ncbi:protein FAR1-RELATED SEQUENCE 6-like [Arachis duranensis]|uniref:Protein FAR1-RELATED SEQUENCE 6-like n=1 Tax=Arachis duranensis TaxID=130453 RepID=A0A6P4D3C7_ARADU|nr:protein FAR1-RELATED SEQUENCE 6-like [Arachis duranensis]
MQTSCVVDEKFVPKVGMIFKKLEEAEKFYKHYSKLADFSTKIKNMTRDRDKIKNQLIVCTREGKWKFKISSILKTNPSAGLNCLARIYVHIMKDVGLWTISKVVLNHSHPCCPDQAKMLKQHRELSMFVRRTIKTHEEAEIRPRKTYQSLVAATGSHRELGFIEKDFKNYITRKVRNISKEDDAKEFGKYLVRMKEKNQNFFFELNLEGNYCIKHTFWVDARSRAAFDYFGDMVSFDITYKQTGFTTYEVIEQVFNSTFNKFAVTYDTVSRGVKCHCLLFESRGILCRHSLSVLSFERVDSVAPKYILERWSKNIKRRHTHIKSSQDKPILEPRSKRFDELVFRSQNICEFASKSEDLTRILHRAFDKVMAEMEEYQERSKEKSLLTHEEATLSNVNDFQSPPRVKTSGRPKNRLGSNLKKKISNAMKKKKKTAPSEIKLTCF